ncbi:MAG: Ig-like domain-containing protein, partial [Niameybacter sp.]
MEWSSSKKNIATVSSKGKVTAKKNGKTTITARIKG